MARLSSDTPSTELLHGTLESMILRVLSDGRAHGYGVGRRIEQTLGDVTPVEDGSLYPALYRLEKRRLIRGAWGVTETGRRARFYELTPDGRVALKARSRQWAAFAGAVTRLLAGER
ncbi:MAG: PadR family transcriptional regulator [Dehalococcoidia bacterium]|nr:MAG: PadR family transcriptional regulator [Dehalococcoidia bacterium]